MLNLPKSLSKDSCALDKEPDSGITTETWGFSIPSISPEFSGDITVWFAPFPMFFEESSGHRLVSS
jgi:hypothetical protein